MGTLAKCRSNEHSSTPFSMADAAIQMSFTGIGHPTAFNDNLFPHLRIDLAEIILNRTKLVRRFGIKRPRT